MKPVECEFESDALAAALQSRWPNRLDPQLRAHIAGCTICSDVVAIASAMDEAREETHARALVPDSGRIWRLAELRARAEAAEAAGRPITAAQLVAFGCAVGLLGACFGATSTLFQSALAWSASSVSGLDPKTVFHSATAFLTEHSLIVLATAMMFLVVPTAVYFALGRD